MTPKTKRIKANFNTPRSRKSKLMDKLKKYSKNNELRKSITLLQDKVLKKLISLTDPLMEFINNQHAENNKLNGKFVEMKKDLLDCKNSFIKPKMKEEAFWNAVQNFDPKGPNFCDLYSSELKKTISTPLSNFKENMNVTLNSSINESAITFESGEVTRFNNSHHYVNESVKGSIRYCNTCFKPIIKEDEVMRTCKVCYTHQHYTCSGGEKGLKYCIDVKISPNLMKVIKNSNYRISIEDMFNKSNKNKDECMERNPKVPEIMLSLMFYIMKGCCKMDKYNVGENPYNSYSTEDAMNILQGMYYKRTYNLIKCISKSSEPACHLMLYLLNQLKEPLLSDNTIDWLNEYFGIFDREIFSSATSTPNGRNFTCKSSNLHENVAECFNSLSVEYRDTLIYFLMHIKIAVKSDQRKNIIDNITYALAGGSFAGKSSDTMLKAKIIIEGLLELDMDFYLTFVNIPEYFYPFLKK